MMRPMTKAEVKAVLDCVLSWQEERQQDAAAKLLMLEKATPITPLTAMLRPHSVCRWVLDL